MSETNTEIQKEETTGKEAPEDALKDAKGTKLPSIADFDKKMLKTKLRKLKLLMMKKR